ncbi:MAG: type II toxin-antitoxin system RelE/ParE family toxin [Lewinellaceae bacterium]|nr:type II toxin-antitoxin system RelE/ParE family toxin [Lewinellaceae bacterium]MCB9287671.1 type II toxin-antitoxin system RelE/ParE family toxin [Lewinellaceae bacterium]
MEEKVVNWTFTAMEMLAELYEYLSEHSEKSAVKYVDGLVEYTERLKKHPESCAPCKNPKLKQAGFRCCQYRNHVIIYEVNEKSVDILAVIHGKRGPRDFEKVVEG